jgi:isoleucyl-tRNA synthetase
VHLCDWPPAGQVNGIILEDMAKVREVITQGLAQRAEAGIRVRQPLQSVSVAWDPDHKDRYEEIIAEELNVKEVRWGASGRLVAIDTVLTPELKREGLARELIRHIQNARKNAGLNVDDRIELAVESDSKEVNAAYEAHKDEIHRETLTTGELAGQGQYSEEVKIDGQNLQIQLSKQG